jgi:hypothetical protein
VFFFVIVVGIVYIACSAGGHADGTHKTSVKNPIMLTEGVGDAKATSSKKGNETFTNPMFDLGTD